ncbi:ARM-repeat/Tetratricopeptide repeat-like protein [Rhynchospora pubera]|uniref:ARM-repeat/Tetratricopeptide repeat-like protein n=1 Tax=Rhynchospora pubera TaxID=906938 RepID=A0AAV8C6C9_9POAL|nr:ARM-repeat/Tetratricopeptide repeat-like protein [Rhynchospora pubera]
MDPGTSTRTKTIKTINKPTYCCFFCALKKPDDTNKRRASLSAFFRDMPNHDDESQVLVLCSIWSMAMADPTDVELPSLGALECMSRLISKSLSNPSWLKLHQNIYIPYYAAHIIGSYTIRVPSLATVAIESGVVSPLISLMQGRISWVEQRVAVRALGHLASYDSTFPAIAHHGKELIPLAMCIASTCLDTIFNQFVCVKTQKREKYQRNLLTRGLYGAEMEDRKAEEWASQIQCWSLYLLSCFASKDVHSHAVMVENVDFLKELCHMWGGLVNGDSPAGIGLMRLLCRSGIGRKGIAQCREVIESLCHLARSCDDWQYMGIDCLLLLLDDPKTRPLTLELIAPYLVDLVELDNLGARKIFGKSITKILLKDHKTCILVPGYEAETALKSLWDIEVERKKKEAAMSAEEITKREALASKKKKEGKERYFKGNVEGAIVAFTEALNICPLGKRKERMVLYSNRAQCYLLLHEPDRAISDATRALSLASPVNWHGKSLWRRSQAYEMKGMAKESLMDCLMFATNCFARKEGGSKRRDKVPYYVARMISKQMYAANLFAHTKLQNRTGGEDGYDGDDYDDDDDDDECTNVDQGSL